MKIQGENKKQFKKKRKEVYEVNDLVPIQRTQYGTWIKLKEKFHGAYRDTKVKSNSHYDVEKVKNPEGE